MKKELLLILALFSVGFLFANKEGETRTAQHTVSISSIDEIFINGKNTYMEIETWNKNEVQVVATVTFDGKMNNRVQEFLDDFEAIVKKGIYKQGGELTIDASLDEPNKVQIGSKNVGVIVGYSDKEFRLSYKIKLPSKNQLDIKAAYEDLFMLGDYSNVTISQYSADLKVGSIENAKLFLKYGDAQIENIKSGYIESYENDTDFGKVAYLKANDKYSEYKFHRVDKLDIQGYETDIKANSIGFIDGNLKYGELEIGEKLNEAKLTLYEYKVRAGQAGSIKLENSKYSEFDFGIVNDVELVSSYEDEFEADFVGTLITKSKYGEYTIDELAGTFELIGYEDEISISKVGDQANWINLDGKYINLDIGLHGRSFALRADVKYGKVDYNESTLEVNKYIKENDQLYIEASPKRGDQNAFKISLKGYEIDADID